MKKLLILISFCFYTQTFAMDLDRECKTIEVKMDECAENSALIDLEGIPSAIVGGVVNTITGHYCESETDVIAASSDPIVVQRTYSCGSDERQSLCPGWALNIEGNIEFFADDGSRKALLNDRGSQVLFSGSMDITGATLKPDKKMLKHGVTNCSSGVLSARYYLMGQRIWYRHNARHCELTTPGGDILKFRSDDEWKKPNENTQYFLQSILRSNRCKREYTYNKHKLSQITSRGSDGTHLCNVKMVHPNKFEKTPELTIQGSDGRHVRYLFEKMDSKEGQHHRYALKEVQRDHAPNVSYQYSYVGRHKPERMIKKMWPEGRSLEMLYYDKGPNDLGGTIITIPRERHSLVGRVAVLYAPVGPDAAPLLTYRFIYNLKTNNLTDKPIGGNTEVTDAYGSKRIFHFSDQHRLSAIEHYANNGSLYRKETIFWNKAFLKARGMEDGKGNVLFCRAYQYDGNGNATKEILAGNLTGATPIHPQINGNGDLINNGCETFERTYIYDKNNLVTRESDGIVTTHYEYYPKSDQIRLKLVSDKTGIRERYYFAYDANGAVILEIVDDGVSGDINNLSGVTERQIKRIYPTTTAPIGLPGVVDTLYLDLTSGVEKRLKKEVNAYSPEGHLVKKNVYDSNNSFAFSQSWAYDAMGNIIEEVDPLGQRTTYAYDANGNCIYKQTPNHEYHKNYVYDFSNRLIREKEVYTNGTVLAKTYTYDRKGRCTSSTDLYGNITRYAYDEFDRVVEKTLPPVLDHKGSFFSQKETLTYDNVNNPIATVDGNGHTTTMAFTAWNKPHIVRYPDGSQERSLYNLNGTLAKVIDGNGVTTVYHYDYKSRKTKEETLSASGALLSSSTWTYNAFHLIAQTDPEGNVTTYEYRASGKPYAIRKGVKETLYGYDALGRKNATWEKYGEGQYKKTLVVNDPLGRVIEERVEDSDNILSMKRFAYDVDGNQTEASVYTDTRVSSTITEYNAHKKPRRITTPDGQVTTIIFHYDHYNQGQPVACEEEVDPKGNITLRIMDTHQKISFEEKKNALGELLQRISYRYDGLGNIIRRWEDLIIAGEKDKTIGTAFAYDPCNRQIEIIEALGTPEQKITRKEYTYFGEIAKITKPDGVILNHHYDELGRLIELISTDGTVHYTYTYDRNDQILASHDKIHHTAVLRSFDPNGRMTQECLSGAFLNYTYDPMGRLVSMTLPDQSSINYQYDALRLRKVFRENYSHEYTYDLSGRVSSTQLPNNLGEVHTHYDIALRPLQIESPYWEEKIGDYDPCGNITNISIKDSLGEVTSHYAYDFHNQLISENGIGHHTYSFDSFRNRLTKDTTTYTNNALNQLIQHDQTQYQYDPNGNLIQQGTHQYQYDALDRLIAVDQHITYQYDAFHRRVCRTQNGITEHFLYQGDKEIGIISQGQIQELRVLGKGLCEDIGAAVAIEIKNHLYVPLHDHRGNIVTLLDAETHTVAQTYRYSAYGEEETTNPISPWRFSSKRIDPETNWAYFGRRYYDPQIGRWTTPDPLGFVDGYNLYCYTHNRPLIFIDPNGCFISGIAGNLARNALSSLRGTHYEEFETICDVKIGERTGLTPTPSQAFTVGNKRSDKFLITTVNGIWNSFDDAQANAERISNMAGGCVVRGVYNASHGGDDLIECGLGLLGISTTPARLLQEEWNEFFQNADEDAMILHVCHSQGAIHTRNALEGFDDELCKRIAVIAVAPRGLCRYRHMRKDNTSYNKSVERYCAAYRSRGQATMSGDDNHAGTPSRCSMVRSQLR